LLQQLGSALQTVLQHVPSEQAPLLCGVVQIPLADAPHKPTQFESAVAAHPASHVTMQHSGLMAHTVLQQLLSEHAGRVWTIRQLSVPLPQVCATAYGVSTSAAALATSVRNMVFANFMKGGSRRRDAIQGSQNFGFGLHQSQ